MIASQTTAVAIRVLSQLRHDKRFVILSLAAPVLLIFMLDIFFDAVPNNPMFDVNSFAPKIAAFIAHFITYVLCAIVLVRERTAHTLTRMFISGYTRTSIIGGYVLAYTLLATLQSLIVLVELNYVFEMSYDLGTFISLYLVMWLLSIISISLGIFVSNFARNEGQVFPFIPLVLMPSVFFSGMIVDLDKMPEWAQPLGYITPMFYATEVVHAIVDAGGNANMMFALIAYGAAVMTLAVFTLREEE